MDPRNARNTAGGPRHPRWLRLGVLGMLLGCGSDPADGPTPRLGEACEQDKTTRCGIDGGTDAELDTVLSCENGKWTQAVACGDGEHCAEDPSRDAVSCTDINDLHVYALLHGPCEVAGAQACSYDRDFSLLCEGGEWQLETNCSTNVQACSLIDAGDDPSCSDDDGCIVCR